MVPHATRRRVLAACGVLAGSVPVVWGLSDGSTTASRSDDVNGWPMAQHDPGGTSYAPNASPPKDGVRVRWKQPIETSIGVSPSPIVANGRVYGVGQELVCVTAAEGDCVFRSEHNAGPPAVATARAYQSPTLVFPTWDGAIGLNARGGVSLAGIRVGLSRWQASRRERDSRIDIFHWSQGHEIPAPVAVDGTVFVTDPGTGSGVMAIDASTGRIRWISPHGQSRPAVRDGTVYVMAIAETGPMAGRVGVFGYDTETVEQTFSFIPPKSMPFSITAAPESLIVGTNDGLVSVDYTETIRRDIYSSTDLVERPATLAVADGVVYTWFVGNNRDFLAAFDVTNGTELWRREVGPETREALYLTPSVANGIVYVPIESGQDGSELVAFDASTGRVRWRFSTGERGRWLSPAALVGETLYTVGNNHIYALEER